LAEFAVVGTDLAPTAPQEVTGSDTRKLGATTFGAHHFAQLISTRSFNPVIVGHVGIALQRSPLVMLDSVLRGPSGAKRRL
jgi:hypothetical protein